jgi:hypothetical protein
MSSRHQANRGVWFEEIERKFAKLSMTTFNYLSSSKLFYGSACPNSTNALAIEK